MVTNLMQLDAAFWQDKRVLVTGHTGFKGAWLSFWLQRLGANVIGISLEPNTNPSLFGLIAEQNAMTNHIQDIRDADAIRDIVKQVQPEIVLHLAAQPLVLESYANPLDTFSSNVMGTANLLEAMRDVESIQVATIITTDKVYRNLEETFPFRESDPLGGHDPYSASKAACEIVVSSYAASFLTAQGVAVTSARAGNVIGGGDWSKDRLIPDAVRAWSTGHPLEVRRPQAVRPWQHVLEPLFGYLRLCEELWQDSTKAGAYNFGPHTHEAASVKDVLTLAHEAFGRGETRWSDGSQGVHEAGWLSLEVTRARQILGIEPRWDLGECVARTMHWYRKLDEGISAKQLCEDDIAAFDQANETIGANN